MDLKEVKEKIEVVSVDPKENEKLKGWIKDPNDCFGRGYHEGGKYCEECTVLSKMDNRYEQLKVFCMELTPKYTPNVDPGKEEGGSKEKPKATKHFKRF